MEPSRSSEFRIGSQELFPNRRSDRSRYADRPHYAYRPPEAHALTSNKGKTFCFVLKNKQRKQKAHLQVDEQDQAGNLVEHHDERAVAKEVKLQHDHIHRHNLKELEEERRY